LVGGVEVQLVAQKWMGIKHRASNCIKARHKEPAHSRIATNRVGKKCRGTVR